MTEHELYDHAAQLAWQRVDELHTQTERCWEAYDQALQLARLAEDAMWAASRDAERLTRRAAAHRVTAARRDFSEPTNGSH